MKAYRIYFLGFKKIDISRDVTFEKDSAYNKSRKRHVEDLEEAEVPRIQEMTMNEATPKEDREMEEPQEPIDPPQEKNPHNRKPAWVREAIQGEERYGAPEEIHRERKSVRIINPTLSKFGHMSKSGIMSKSESIQSIYSH